MVKKNNNNNMKPGPTGKFPDGKIHPEDEGELIIGVAADVKNKQVVIDFNKDISWLAFPPDMARDLAQSLIDKAEEIEKSTATNKITLYADGACSVNPGKGAYATIVKVGDKEREVVRAFTFTTNNRMELLGVIEPIEGIKKPSAIDIYSDSQYVVNAINEGWLNNWIANNWRKSNRKPVLNIDLWKRMRAILIKHKLTFHWVRGHDGNPIHDRCDELAVATYNGNDFSEDEGYNG